MVEGKENVGRMYTGRWTRVDIGRLTPMTLSEPISLISLSCTLPCALPWPSVLKLPRSPTWRSESSGAPWVLLWGLTIIRVSALYLQHCILQDEGLDKRVSPEMEVSG